MSTSAPPASLAPIACPLCGAATVTRHVRLARFDVWRCGACTLRFRRPLPGPDELQSMYEDERYHASVYFENARAGYRRSSPEIRIYRRALDDLRALGARGRLLDVDGGRVHGISLGASALRKVERSILYG